MYPSRLFHAACFSENGDLLSQWRAYSDDGLGYSLGFSTERRFAVAPYWPARLQRIVYDADEQEALLAGTVRSLIDPRNESLPQEEQYSIQTALLDVLPSLTDPAFREEREWRLVTWSAPFLDVVLPFVFTATGFGIAHRMPLACYPNEKYLPAAIYDALDLPKIVHRRERPPGTGPPPVTRATTLASNASTRGDPGLGVW